jgi:hypothetical protein
MPFFLCAVKAEASLWTTTLMMEPVGYRIGYGRFAFPCSARQPEYTRFVFSSFVNPDLYLRQDVFPSARETTLVGIPPGTFYIKYVL